MNKIHLTNFAVITISSLLFMGCESRLARHERTCAEFKSHGFTDNQIKKFSTELDIEGDLNTQARKILDYCYQLTGR